jgi:hypothetical protein
LKPRRISRQLAARQRLFQRLGQQQREQPPVRQARAELQPAVQPAQRAGVDEGRPGLGVRRRLLKAAGADRARRAGGRHRQGATRAGMPVPGQLFAAARAKIQAGMPAAAAERAFGGIDQIRQDAWRMAKY